MNYSSKQAWTDFKVGLLTFIAILILMAGISFAGGNKGILFRETVRIIALLPDVGSLKTGSSVSMGGMTVGKVVKISFLDTENTPQIEVVAEVQAAVRERIKADSVPMVRTQGMMGDRYLDISMGTQASPVLRENTPLVGSGASDFDASLRQATATLAEAQKLLSAVNQKQGTMGQFFYDEKFYKGLSDTTTALHELIQDVKERPRRYIKLSLF